MRRFGWLFICAVFLLFVILAYQMVDTVEAAEEDPYDIPQSVIDSTERWGAEYSISPEFMQAVFWAESRYNPQAINRAGTCFGLGQIKESCHRERMERLGVSSLFDPDGNTAVSCDYFRELFEKYEDPAIVLGFYHGEPDAIWKAETGNLSSYTKGILQMAVDFEYAHNKKEIEQKSDFRKATLHELAWENSKG